MNWLLFPVLYMWDAFKTVIRRVLYSDPTEATESETWNRCPCLDLKVKWTQRACQKSRQSSKFNIHRDYLLTIIPYMKRCVNKVPNIEASATGFQIHATNVSSSALPTMSSCDVTHTDWTKSKRLSWLWCGWVAAVVRDLEKHERYKQPSKRRNTQFTRPTY